MAPAARAEADASTRAAVPPQIPNFGRSMKQAGSYDTAGRGFQRFTLNKIRTNATQMALDLARLADDITDVHAGHTGDGKLVPASDAPSTSARTGPRRRPRTRPPHPAPTPRQRSRWHARTSRPIVEGARRVIDAALQTPWPTYDLHAAEVASAVADARRADKHRELALAIDPHALDERPHPALPSRL